YGGEKVVTGSDINNYKFTGKERDAESGLDYFDARHYANAWGRFMQPDWAAKPTDVAYADFGVPQSLSLYGDVKNNPLSRADKDGHETQQSFSPEQLESIRTDIQSAGTAWQKFSANHPVLSQLALQAVVYFATKGESGET